MQNFFNPTFFTQKVLNRFYTKKIIKKKTTNRQNDFNFKLPISKDNS